MLNDDTKCQQISDLIIKNCITTLGVYQNHKNENYKESGIKETHQIL